jgi:DNA polymerase III alpha subunit
MFERIISVEEIGDEETYDLEIDSKDHNFYANNICVSNSHSTTYGYIAYQTLYFKTYYPAYFYAAMINMENDIEKIPDIIADAKENNIKILPHSIIKSHYPTMVESDDSIRLGFGMIKGMGDAVRDEMIELKLNECETLGDVLKKPFKKINATQLQNLIDLGCFDEFGVDRSKITSLKDLYSDTTIEKWFTRKTQTLRLEVIPKILKEQFDPTNCLKIALKVKSSPLPHLLLVNELVKNVDMGKFDEKKYMKETIKKQNELMGFNLKTDNKLNELAYSFKVKGTLPISEFDDPNKSYYFTVEKKAVALTKTGKKYLNLTLSDGHKSIKAKCWRELDIEENEIYYGKLMKDTYGFTLKPENLFKV